MLPLTRAVAYAIVPFLVAGFAVLYPVPGDTESLFAWPIRPGLTAMVLGSAYLGGAYFFVRVARSQAWHTVKGGFVPVGLFATLMGISTVLHWDRFTHDHVAFWLWTLLYCTTPFLIAAVWLRNRPYDAAADPGEPLVPWAVAMAMLAAGVLAVATAGLLYLAPATAARWWPWPLTPLTARVLGAVLCLGSAGIGAALDRRWSAARLPLQVAAIMLTLMLVAGLRARADLDAASPLTYVFAAGFAALAAGIVVLYRIMERAVRPGRRR